MIVFFMCLYRKWHFKCLLLCTGTLSVGLSADISFVVLVSFEKFKFVFGCLISCCSNSPDKRLDSKYITNILTYF